MNISAISTLFNRNLYSSTKELSILNYFLTIDIGGRPVSSLINWLKDEKYDSAVLNYSYIKKNGPKISIYCFYDGYEREYHPDRDKFEIEKDELIKIAEQWQELYPKYQFIRIIEEKGHMYISGSTERVN